MIVETGLKYGKFSRFDETRRARWSRVMVSVTCNYVGLCLQEAFQGEKYTPITAWPALRF